MALPNLFHESWYRIAKSPICLSPHVTIQRQLYRGERWIVLHNPMSFQFYRLRPQAFHFISRLSLNKTVEEVWTECMEMDADHTPGQEEVIHLLAQLYYANMLHYKTPPDSIKLFERYQKRKRKLLQGNMLNIMFLRIPLFDPNRLLQFLSPVIRVCFSWAGAAVWLAVVVGALKVCIDHFDALRIQTQGILDPGNLFLLYVSLVLIKTFHEFGHAFAVRRFGGEVHTMGVMFLLFSPLPYVDATASWSFRSKWKRAFVGLAGMIVELFIAGIFAFIWAYTGPGIVHSLSYNILFIASVSTVLFNINPLLRFDGYYILSDLLDIPNLHTQAQKQIVHLVEYYAFGRKQSSSPVRSRRESILLTVFGILSSLYRIVVFVGILFFIADKFLLLGILMALVCAVAWIVTPLVKFCRYVSTSPNLHRVRSRAIGVSASVVGLIFCALYLIPFPQGFQTWGILNAQHHQMINTAVEGTIIKVQRSSGSDVKQGETLLVLSNPEIDLQIEYENARLLESYTLLRDMRLNDPSNISSVERYQASIQKILDNLNQKKERLVITAPFDGRWVSPDLTNYIGRHVGRGTVLGELIDENSFYFTCILKQEDAKDVLENQVKKAQIRLKGQTSYDIEVTDIEYIPMEQNRLPSAALGWNAGGSVATDVKDPEGLRTQEPYYQVIAHISAEDAVLYMNQLTGKIRFELTPKPLLRQWIHRMRQLVQKRYQL